MLKKIFVTMMVFLLSVSFVSALDLDVESITLNDRHDLDLEGDTNLVRLERGERVDLEVCYSATSDIKDLEMNFFMRGYEYETISDSSSVFDVYAGEVDCRDFTFDIPREMFDQKFNIWFTATNAYDDLRSINFPVRVRGSRHDIAFDDVSISPRNKVEAGSAIYASARLINLGERAHDDVKVEFSIPELGLTDSYYMDFERGESFRANEREATSEMYLRIPRTVEEGNYDVELKAIYNRGNDYDVWTDSIEILGSSDLEEDAVSKKSTITVASDYQSVNVGEKSTFPVMIENDGDSKTTYELKAYAISDWGNTMIEPENYFVLNAGESRTVYVSAEPRESGRNNLLVQVDVNNGEYQRDLSLTVNAEKEKVVDDVAGWDNVKRGLEIGLIVLIGLLIILALVVAFSGKGKKSNEKGSDDDSETYY
ncbi:MAG: hypothetical protein ACOCRO_00285 [Halanaerobiales bacterium]